MAESESALLRRFVGAADSGAFAEIVRRHAGLVYGTCLRILADADQAADATQETFYQLMRKAGEIKGSLSGWLHRVAVRKAVDVIRNDSARRQRERVYVDARSDEDPTWKQVSPYVDEALNGLDDQTRALLICHYLEGRSMTDLAEQMGVSRPTISRRIDAGLTTLRAQLKRQGILATAAGLSTLLAQNAAQSAPSALLCQLGKMTLMGTSATAAATSVVSSPAAVTTGLVAAAKTKFVIAAAVVAVGAGLVTYKSLSPGPPEAVPTASMADRNEGRPDGEARMFEPQRPTIPTRYDETGSQDSTEKPVPAQASPARAEGLQEPAVESLVAPLGSEATEASGFQLDLSSPEATVRSFTRAIASGDAESVMACFLPDGLDSEDMQEILDADADDPERRSQYEMRLWFQSLDPDAEIPIVSVEETEYGAAVVWRVTFKKDVTMGRHTFAAGDTFDLDGTLRRSGDSWLIDGI